MSAGLAAMINNVLHSSTAIPRTGIPVSGWWVITVLPWMAPRVLPVVMSIPTPLAPLWRLAFPWEALVGSLAMAMTGTFL